MAEASSAACSGIVLLADVMLGYRSSLYRYWNEMITARQEREVLASTLFERRALVI